MKLPIAIITVFLFFFCLIVFGMRGLDAAIISVLTFLAGIKVGQKEQAVTSYVNDLIQSFKTQFNQRFKS